MAAKLRVGIAKGSERRPHKFLIPTRQFQLSTPPRHPGERAALGLRAGTDQVRGSGVSGEEPAELQAAAGVGQGVA